MELADVLRLLPVSEKAEAARKVLAEKHDDEIVAMERRQQEDAAREYRLHIKRVMDAKVATTKALPEHVSTLSERAEGQLQPVDDGRPERTTGRLAAAHERPAGPGAN